MKKFEFSLTALYSMKENNEKQQKMQLKNIQNEINDLESKIAAVNADYAKAKDEFGDNVTTGLGASHATNYGDYFSKLRTVAEQIAIKKNKLERKKEKVLAKLIETRKEKVMLEKLRDKEYEEYLSEIKKKQDKELDDFFSYQVTVS